jgi:phosphatidylinositol alpha-mannosyltransferase
LVIAGDGPDREKLEEYVEEFGLPNVSFLGFVSDETKLQLLQTADLFCAPAIYGESFGLVLLEAMACGLVAVAGDNSGYSGLMQEVGALSLVNPRETDEFARRLRLLLNEESLRTAWQKWAKSYIKQYDYSNIIKRYEDLYDYMLKHHAHKIKAFDD